MTEKQHDVKNSRSRSQSRPQQNPKREFSTNPFFNFVRDFKDSNNNNIKSSQDLVKAAGERWRTMSDADKSPYVNAAKEAKNKNNQQQLQQQQQQQQQKDAVVKPLDVGIEKPKRNAVKRRRCCSRCGHREGSPVAPEDKVCTRTRWRRKRGPRFPRRTPYDDDDDEDSKEPDSDEDHSRSRSRSRSESGSKSGTPDASDSSAPFF